MQCCECGCSCRWFASAAPPDSPLLFQRGSPRSSKIAHIASSICTAPIGTPTDNSSISSFNSRSPSGPRGSARRGVSPWSEPEEAGRWLSRPATRGLARWRVISDGFER